MIALASSVTLGYFQVYHLLATIFKKLCKASLPVYYHRRNRQLLDFEKMRLLRDLCPDEWRKE